MNNKELIKAMQQLAYNEMKEDFLSLGHGGHYTNKQKKFAIGLIDEYGVRATTRILELPRRTLQRCCRHYDCYVKRCPAGDMNGLINAKEEENFGSGGDIIS